MDIPAAAAPYIGAGVMLSIDLGEKSVDDYYANAQTKGVHIESGLEEKFWGDRLFTIKDPDGYLLTFSQHVRDVTGEEMAQAAAQAV